MITLGHAAPFVGDCWGPIDAAASTRSDVDIEVDLRNQQPRAVESLGSVVRPVADQFEHRISNLFLCAESRLGFEEEQLHPDIGEVVIHKGIGLGVTDDDGVGADWLG